MSLAKAPVADALKELNVGRINIVDSDGTVRMVIANRDLFPTEFRFGNETFTHVNRGPGVLFFNDEGVECGGLIWSGSMKDGKRTADASLMFDQYDQDQVVGLQYSEEDGERHYGLTIWDRPEQQGLRDLCEGATGLAAMPSGPAKAEARRALNKGHAERLFVGRNPTGAVIRLGDAGGRTRFRVRVDNEGVAQLEFLNAEGTVVRRLTADGDELR